MTRKRQLSHLCLGFCLLFSAGLKADNVFNIDASLAYATDANLNRAAADNLKLDDSDVTANAGVNFSSKLSQHAIITYLASFRYVSFSEYDGLNHAEFRAGINYKNKPDLTFGGLTYIVDVNSYLVDYETDIRDSNIVSVGLTLSRWFTDRISARTGVQAKYRDSDSRVFDSRDYRLFVNADLHVSNQGTFYATWSFVSGQTVSTIPLSVQNAAVLKVIGIADQIEFDPTFAPDELAYRFDTRTQVFTLGFNYAVDRRQSFDLSAGVIGSSADAGVDYTTRVFSLSYLLRFRI